MIFVLQVSSVSRLDLIVTFDGQMRHVRMVELVAISPIVEARHQQILYTKLPDVTVHQVLQVRASVAHIILVTVCILFLLKREKDMILFSFSYQPEPNLSEELYFI